MPSGDKPPLNSARNQYLTIHLLRAQAKSTASYIMNPLQSSKKPPADATPATLRYQGEPRYKTQGVQCSHSTLSETSNPRTAQCCRAWLASRGCSSNLVNLYSPQRPCPAMSSQILTLILDRMRLPFGVVRSWGRYGRMASTTAWCSAPCSVKQVARRRSAVHR